MSLDDQRLTSKGLTPSQGRLRVESSHMMTPKLKTSHLSVTGSFRKSSGAVHSGVPTAVSSQ